MGKYRCTVRRGQRAHRQRHVDRFQRRCPPGGVAQVLGPHRDPHEPAEGNAFFAEELVSGGCSDGLPHGLVELLVARVEALAPGTQRLLRIAAVAGRRVRHDRLVALAGTSDDELEQALREAVAAHVLVSGEAGDAAPAAASAPDTYAFRHALLAEAVYHELLPGERSRLHAAFAGVLAVPGTVDEPGVAAAIAHHAMAAHDLPVALGASVRAAREADERHAPAELLRHAGRALELWPAVPAAAEVAGIDEARVTLWASWAAGATGDPDRGIALARRAVELADERGDPGLCSFTRRRYALSLLELSGREQEALAAARDALELIAGEPPGPDLTPADLAWSHTVLARALLRLDRYEEAARQAETVLEVARSAPAGDTDTAGAQADALVNLAVCEERAGRPELARVRLAEVMPLARQAGNLAVELRAHYNLGLSLLDEGCLAEAGAAFATGEARAAETGTTRGGYGLELRVAHVITLFLRGEWPAAQAAAAPAGEAVSATVAGRLAAAGLLVTVARGQFDLAAVRITELQRSQPVDDQVIMLVGETAAEAALWQGRPAEAAERTAEAIAGVDSGPYAALGPHLGGIKLAALGIAAQAGLAAAGAVPRSAATAAAHRIAEHAEATARDGMPRAGVLGPEGRAWLYRARAELTRLTGPDPEAWSTVVKAFGYGDRYRQAQALLGRAEALLATGAGPAGAVAEDLQAALATAEELGAAPLAGAVRALAGRAGVRPVDPGTPPATAPGAGPLTPRERTVLALVARGGTNRQVGAELFISEKTVSVHLSRVMAKLGAGSRTEAVTVAYARGLLAPEGQEMAR